MANKYRGEIDAVLDGRNYKLCLTLGALAELEQALQQEDMLGVAERFSSGRIKAADAILIIAAGLRGSGHDFDEEAVSKMHAEDGAAGFVDIVARLLNATFGGDEPESGITASSSVRSPGLEKPQPVTRQNPQ